MNINQIHPDLQRFEKHFQSPRLHNLFIAYISKLLPKLSPPPGGYPGVITENRKLSRYVRVRIYRPEEEHSGAALLWIHGGGFIGGRHEDDRVCGAFARNLKLTVISVKYRLSLLNQYPCAIEDCTSAWWWLQHEADSLGIDPTRIAIGGQCAGGGLAVCLAHRLADTGYIQPAAQLLFSPMLDDHTALRYELDGINHFVWNNRINRQAWSWYLRQPAGSVTTPPYAVAARREELFGLSPTWITVSDIELFYDENCSYAERLKKAGVKCYLHITPRTPHCFDVVAPESMLARDMRLSAYQFLNDALHLQLEKGTYNCLQENIKDNTTHGKTTD